jgi:hypothetical protein
MKKTHTIEITHDELHTLRLLLAMDGPGGIIFDAIMQEFGDDPDTEESKGRHCFHYVMLCEKVKALTSQLPTYRVAA